MVWAVHSFLHGPGSPSAGHRQPCPPMRPLPVFHLYNPVNSCCLPALPNANSPTRLSCTHCPRAASFPVSHHAWAPYPALWVLPTAPRPPQLGAELLQLGAGPSCLMSQGSAMSAPAHSTHVLPADRGTPGLLPGGQWGRARWHRARVLEWPWTGQSGPSWGLGPLAWGEWVCEV